MSKRLRIEGFGSLAGLETECGRENNHGAVGGNPGGSYGTASCHNDKGRLQVISSNCPASSSSWIPPLLSSSLPGEGGGETEHIFENTNTPGMYDSCQRYTRRSKPLFWAALERLRGRGRGAPLLLQHLLDHQLDFAVLQPPLLPRTAAACRRIEIDRPPNDRA